MSTECCNYDDCSNSSFDNWPNSPETELSSHDMASPSPSSSNAEFENFDKTHFTKIDTEMSQINRINTAETILNLDDFIQSL